MTKEQITKCNLPHTYIYIYEIYNALHSQGWLKSEAQTLHTTSYSLPTFLTKFSVRRQKCAIFSHHCC